MNDTYKRAGIAIIVGIVTWIVLAGVGLLISKYADQDIGGYITGFSVLLGVAAGVYYFLTSRRLV